jgi:hypothetical protein
MSVSPPRSSPIVLAELAEVRRHLDETPPHHGAGVRDSLQATVRRLESELAAVRRAESDRHR